MRSGLLRLILSAASSLLVASLSSQTFVEGLVQTYELQSTLGSDRTPFWLQSNRYGLSSLEAPNGYLRGSVVRPLSTDSLKRWGIGYGIDLAVTQHFASTIHLQQAFADLRYRHLVVTLGQKEQPLQLRHQRLSSGSQTLGINARPVPGFRLEVPHYWSVPGTRDWLALRGHVFYGMTTDGSWQADWTERQHRYAEHVLLHTKAGYLRVGPQSAEHPYSLELGLEMACQFGGTLYNTMHGTVKGNTGLRAFSDAFFVMGSDEVDATYHNVGGNQLGSWLARFNYDWPSFGLSFYADHFFEDHSSMFLLDYDGYGQGSDWNHRQDSRYLFYPLCDLMLGLEVRLPFPWLRTLVVEHLDTRYQSGPIYHDHNPGLSDHIGGDDNYYNHYLYSGWTHWGQAMGNPLYRSPLYNDDHTLSIQSNRFQAWHVGAEGAWHCPKLEGDYRMLFSSQQSWGTYQSPYLSPQDDQSLLAEVSARLSDAQSSWSRYTVRAAFGWDRGELLGTNTGLQLSIIYSIP